MVMQRLFKGSLGSFSFFGMGFMSLKFQSVGFKPDLKHKLKNLCKSNFAFKFLAASLGISRYAFLILQLLMALETSSKENSKFKESELNSFWTDCCSGERLSNSCFFPKFHCRKGH